MVDGSGPDIASGESATAGVGQEAHSQVVGDDCSLLNDLLDFFAKFTLGKY